MWFTTVILLLAFLTSGLAFGGLLAKYKNLQDSTDNEIQSLRNEVKHWIGRNADHIESIDVLTGLNVRQQSQIKILNGMVERRNQRVDYYKREVDKCKDEHKNMSKMLTLALNDSNPFTRKKALRVP